MEDGTTFHFTGPSVADERDAPGFIIDEKGVYTFVPMTGAEDGDGFFGECVVYRRGYAWHRKAGPRQPQFLDRSHLDGMAFTTQDRVDDVCVFLNGKRIGKGRIARIEFGGDERSAPVVRLGGRVIARWRNGAWHRVDRKGQSKEPGRLTIGPVDLYGDAAATPEERQVRFTPGPRVRTSPLASARLAA